MKSQNILHFTSWIGSFILLVSLVSLIFNRNIHGSLTVLVFLTLSLVFKFLKNKLPTALDLLFIISSLMNAAAWIWKLNDSLWFFDDLTHTVTTLTITSIIGYYLFSNFIKVYSVHKLLFIFTVVLCGIAIGALWEIFEWTLGELLHKEIIKSLADTIFDLLFDTLGSLGGAILTLFLLKHKKN